MYTIFFRVIVSFSLWPPPDISWVGTEYPLYCPLPLRERSPSLFARQVIVLTWEVNVARRFAFSPAPLVVFFDAPFPDARRAH